MMVPMVKGGLGHPCSGTVLIMKPRKRIAKLLSSWEISTGSTFIDKFCCYGSGCAKHISDYSEATGSTSGGYEIATGSRDIVADISSEFTEKFSTEEPISNFHLVDLRGKAPKSRVSNTFATWTGFTPPNDPSDWQRIDFIFGGSNGGWYVIYSLQTIANTDEKTCRTAEGYHVLNVLEDDGYLTSDHRPVIVDVSI